MATNLGSIPLGTVGAYIELTIKDQDGTVVDVSGAASKTIRFEKPDGSRVDKTASFTTDGTDGKIRYATQSGVLDTSGAWEVMGLVVIGTDSYPTDVLKLTVAEVLAAP
jgi:hypothetical protein